ncbi:MAG: hypothetical protein KME11_21600 [Timaviella obliquedivisa GSE-PSE-MK23-08B]|jgi:hypothetical protein|nr:hypothetical protein [Timaviella obliquedivisa GSE-PSE-MK23-08B]
MANSNPVQSEGFKAQQIPKYGETALSKRVVGIRFPVNVDEVLQAMTSEERQRLIRDAVECRLKDAGQI